METPKGLMMSVYTMTAFGTELPVGSDWPQSSKDVRSSMSQYILRVQGFYIILC